MPCYLKTKKSSFEIATLQVQANKNNKRAYIKASFTIEASFTLSIFIFTLIIFLGFFEMLNTHRYLLSKVDALSKNLSNQYAYLQELEFNKQEENKEIIEFLKEESIKFIIISLFNQKNLKIRKIDLKVFDDKENIDVNIEYDYMFNKPLINKAKIRQKIKVKRRAYIGKESRKIIQNENEEIVFVGNNLSRYHLDRNCHYLSNELRKVKKIDLKTTRNKNGSKYSPCLSCVIKNKEIMNEDVFITDSGLHYHVDKNCKTLRSYVREVKKNLVEHLGECSYCGGKH